MLGSTGISVINRIGPKFLFPLFHVFKTFHGGVFLEQILSACHWKSHNTFTQLYLKDVAWADSEVYHLGPIVAAQQVHS